MFLQEFGMNNNTYWLQRIEKINIGQYNISLISAENKIINAIAVIKYDKEHSLINFVPDVIGKLVMRENLNVRALCAAIVAFDKAQDLDLK